MVKRTAENETNSRDCILFFLIDIFIYWIFCCCCCFLHCSQLNWWMKWSLPHHHEHSRASGPMFMVIETMILLSKESTTTHKNPQTPNTSILAFLSCIFCFTIERCVSYVCLMFLYIDSLPSSIYFLIMIGCAHGIYLIVLSFLI